MKLVVQRVTRASVAVNNKIHNSINSGLLILCGIQADDNNEDIDYLVNKITNLRIFSDNNSDFNNSILDISGEILLISQFTLLANTRKGRRPSWDLAANSTIAKPIYNLFLDKLQNQGLVVKDGIFGSDMQIELVNDGPVTIIIDSKDRLAPRK
tara:strand:+ start:82 stop:543 length:462 start_codon:yes stop_codon:yes gene_type:complete